MLIPKANIIRDRKYLDYVRTLPCVVTGRTGEDIDPAHIRYGLSGGMGIKPSDNLVVPLCNELHRKQHNGSEVGFWLKYLPENPDTLMRCLKAYAIDQYAEWDNRRSM